MKCSKLNTQITQERPKQADYPTMDQSTGRKTLFQEMQLIVQCTTWKAQRKRYVNQAVQSPDQTVHEKWKTANQTLKKNHHPQKHC